MDYVAPRLAGTRVQYLRVGGVVVLGSINMDLVVRVSELPHPGDTVLGDRLMTVHGGKGANQAVAAARLGARVRMIGRVGEDAFGAELVAGLREDGVDTAGVGVDRAQPSGAALIVIEGSGQNMITVAPGANSTVGDADIARLHRDLQRDDVVVLQLELPIQAVMAGIEAARLVGARVILNVSPSAPMAGLPVPRVEVAIVNQREAEELGVENLRRSAGALVVTLGAEGSVLYENDRATRILPHQVEAVDATGAGDALVGAVAFSLANGALVIDALRLGGAAGAAAVTKLGARPSLPRPADLKRLFGIELDAPARRIAT